MKDNASITVRNAQRKMRVESKKLNEFAANALRLVRALPQKRGGVLASLKEVTVILVSDRRMAEVHQTFLATAGPTDVITFQDGDIFVSVETAARNSRRFRTTVQGEISIYIVHGLLHLHGFDDTTPEKSRAMEVMQKRILREARRTKRSAHRAPMV